jgi:hypothetical protein
VDVNVIKYIVEDRIELLTCRNKGERKVKEKREEE